MEGKMKTAVMLGIGKMGFEERNIPKTKDNEVLVRLEYVGICGSDLHYYETGAIGDYVVKPPFVLGHEPGGTVVEVGKDVKHLKVGDRVALEPGKTCGHCEFCKTGRYNLCPDVIFFATPPVDGVFQEYVAHEADLCFKLPDNVSTMEGALIEPLADRSGHGSGMYRSGNDDGFKSHGCIQSVCGGYHGKTSSEGIGTGSGRGNQRQSDGYGGRGEEADGRKGMRPCCGDCRHTGHNRSDDTYD